MASKDVTPLSGWPATGKPLPLIRAWMALASGFWHGPEVVRVSPDAVVPVAGLTDTVPGTSAPAGLSGNIVTAPTRPPASSVTPNERWSNERVIAVPLLVGGTVEVEVTGEVTVGPAWRPAGLR